VIQNERSKIKRPVENVGIEPLGFTSISAFVFGLGLMIHFRVGVRVSLTEILVPFLIATHSNKLQQLFQNSSIVLGLKLLVLYGVSIAMSDFLQDVPFEDTIRAIVIVGFLFTILISVGLILIEGLGLIVTILSGFAFGTLLHLFFNTAGDLYDFSSESLQYAFFVFRFSPALTSWTCLLAYHLSAKGKTKTALMLIISSMVIAVYFTTRSACFSWLLAVTCCSYAMLQKGVDSHTLLFPARKMVVLAVALSVMSIGSYYLYRELATRGLLGNSLKAQDNLKVLYSESETGVLGLLMRGRTEVLASILMILDSPIIGLGTSADSSNYYDEAFAIAGKGTASFSTYTPHEDGRIRSGHSMIFHSWASNGIFALPFWLYVLFMLYRTIIMLMLSKSKYLWLLILLLISAIWDIVFSPMSVQSRAWIPCLLAFSAVYLAQVRQSALSTLDPYNRSLGWRYLRNKGPA